jgi:TPR repeat protein
MLLFVAGVTLGLSACGSCNNKRAGITTPSPTPRDPIAECHALAPEDPYVDDKQGGELAYAACQEAVRLNTGDGEIVYLLATSALQSDRMDEAIAGFQKAEQLGSCKALYFLGDNKWYAEKDETAAADYYKRGAECGDERAAQELFSPATFESSAHPELIAALYTSDIEKLNRVRFVTASYVGGFYEALSEQFLGKDFDPCWTATHYRGGETLFGLNAAEKGDATNYLEGKLYEEALPFAFNVLFPEQGSKALAEFREAERRAGHADLIRLIQSSRCDALLPHRFVKGVEEFAKAKRPLIEVVREKAPQVRSVSDLVEWVRQRNQSGQFDK